MIFICSLIFLFTMKVTPAHNLACPTQETNGKTLPTDLIEVCPNNSPRCHSLISTGGSVDAQRVQGGCQMTSSLNTQTEESAHNATVWAPILNQRTTCFLLGRETLLD